MAVRAGAERAGVARGAVRAVGTEVELVASEVETVVGTEVEMVVAMEVEMAVETVVLAEVAMVAAAVLVAAMVPALRTYSNCGQSNAYLVGELGVHDNFRVLSRKCHPPY